MEKPEKREKPEKPLLWYIFVAISYLGFWRPENGWKSKIYYLYTIAMVCSIFMTFTTQVTFIVTNIKNVEEVISIAFLQLTEFCAFTKMMYFIFKRKTMKNFIKFLSTGSCMTNGEKEIELRKGYDKRMRRYNALYIFYVECLLLIVTLKSVFEDIPARTLPFPAWIPFEHTESIRYWFPFFHQVIMHHIFASTALCFDTLLFSLMYQSCAQMGLLRLRLQMIPTAYLEVKQDDGPISEATMQRIENNALGACIRHHLEIISFAESINSAFQGVMFLQSVVTTFVLCVSIFLLARLNDVDGEFVFLAVYIFCHLLQLFMYCWYGNELTVQSAAIRDSVYEMNWRKLTLPMQKSILIVLIRTLRPVSFVCGALVTWNLDMFISLTKFSYSMYNLLDTTN